MLLRCIRACVPFCAILGVFVAVPPAHSQTAPSPKASIVNRISQDADWSQLQPMANHVPLWANAANDAGPASGDIAGTVVLARSPQQQADLEQFLAAQQNPASADFHHWLTPAEFGQRFGLSDADLESVKSWLQQQGLRITFVAPGRTFIGFSAAAPVVAHAFGTQIRNYTVGGAQRMSITSAPLIPAAIAPVVQAIHGLYTIDDQPMHLATEPQTAGPEITASNGTHYLMPGDFAKIYDAPTSISPTQQTIGIVGRSRVNMDDVRNFAALAGSFLFTPAEVVPTAFGGVDPGPAWTTTPPSGTSLGEQSEATLDITRSGSVAQGTSLLLVVATPQSGGIETDAQYLVQTSPLPAQVMSISYGACEAAAGQAGVSYWDKLFQQAAAEGISVFVSSGDSAAAGCEQAFTTPQAAPPALSPNYICSSSYVTCVGGTEFNDVANPGQYWGPNGPAFTSALGYIPEGGWNEPTSQGKFVVAGSGGGVSSLVPTPLWQTNPGVPSARTGRYTPDMSFTSSCHDAYVMCFAAAGASCLSDSSGRFSFVGMCGTSAAAPSMAGVAALLDDKMKSPQGNLNPALYALALNQPSTLHDTTPASSGVAVCDIQTPSMCNNSTPGVFSLTAGQAGYAVTTGYDMVTGLGSIDVANFLSAYTTALPQPAVTVTPSLTTMTADQDLTISIQVAGTQGQPTPSGSVTITAQSFTTKATLQNGSATVFIPADTLSANYYASPTIVTAHYSPDANSAPNYFQSTGTANIQLKFVTPTVTLSIAPASPTTAQDLTVTVKVAGGSAGHVPTGIVGVTQSATGTVLNQATTLSGGIATITVPAGILPAGSVDLAANYLPDANGWRLYNSAYGTATVTLTGIPKTTPALSFTPSSPTPVLGDPITLNFNINAGSGKPTPTGMVQATVAGYSAFQWLANGAAAIALPIGLVPAGAQTVAASYSGDANYNATTTTATLNVAKNTPKVIFNFGNITSVQADTPLRVSILVQQAGYYTVPSGTIRVTSGTYDSGPLSINGLIDLSIPAGKLAVGTDTLTATYSGDANYNPSTGTATITVTNLPPSLSVSGNDLTLTAGSTGTSPITITPQNGFTGAVTLTASIAQSPAGAQNLPTLSFGSTSPVTITGPTAGSATLTITTTAATAAQLHNPWRLPAGTALALLILCGIPARRRKLRAWFGIIALLTLTSAAIAACGGAGASTTNTTSSAPTGHPGTTPGTYVITITATSGALTTTNTVKLLVQ